LDFDWPLKKRWHGYVNPHYRKCSECDAGYSAEYRALERIVHLLLIAGEDSQRRPADFVPSGRCVNIPTYTGSPHNRLYPHPYLIEAGVADPGRELWKVTNALADRGPGVLGYDCIATWNACEKVLIAAGMTDEEARKRWGRCEHCGGDAVDPEVKAEYEAWERFHPPTGDGWQMWETTSEGSPISPVFKTPERLARWLADNRASACGAETATYEQWLGMVRGGWAPSMVGGSGGMRSGVEFIGDAENDKEARRQ
jgi:hypothetical protein